MGRPPWPPPTPPTTSPCSPPPPCRRWWCPPCWAAGCGWATTCAVGHPLRLVGSLSAGVVSATDRDVPISADRTLEGLIQFDAAVNPGNSGGPLLNRAGQVVGVVTALANPADVGFFVGIGFAVPIATAGGAAGGPSQ
ncbi:MAG: trypsin-like peptidase domain-containing protein [Acidimicrobiales bacterium]